MTGPPDREGTPEDAAPDDEGGPIEGRSPNGTGPSSAPDASSGALPPALSAASLPAGPPEGAPPPEPRPPVFSLDRPAPALYVLGWLLSIGGALTAAIGFVASATLARYALVLGGFAVLTVGLLAAAGYQVVARSRRPETAYRGPSPLIGFALVFVVANLLEGLLSVLGVHLAPPGGAAPGGWDLLVALVLTALAYLVVVWLLAVRTGALTWPQMGWPAPRPGRATAVARAFVWGVALAIPMRIIVGAWSLLLVVALGVPSPQQFAVPTTAQDAVLLLVSAVVLAPIFEELFFRGFAYTAWRRDLGVSSAIIRTALLFAAVHTLGLSIDPRQALLVFLVILPLGAFLAWLREQRGIVASIAGHATYNGSILLLLLAVRPPAA